MSTTPGVEPRRAALDEQEPQSTRDKDRKGSGCTQPILSLLPYLAPRTANNTSNISSRGRARPRHSPQPRCGRPESSAHSTAVQADLPRTSN